MTVHLGPRVTCEKNMTAENTKAQNRWSKEEKKLLVRLWVEKHDQLEKVREDAHSMVLCFVHRFCS